MEKRDEQVDILITQLSQLIKLLERFEFHYYNLSRDINALTDAIEDDKRKFKE